MILTHGANSLPNDMVYFDGVYVKDAYYSRQDGNVGSTFKDLVSLPEGYIKLDYVVNNSVTNSGGLIDTGFNLPESFSIRTCFERISIIYNFSYIFTTTVPLRNSIPMTRLFNGLDNDDARYMLNISNTAGNSLVLDTELKSFEMRQVSSSRSYRTSLLSNKHIPFTEPYDGSYDKKFYLLSRRGKVKLFTFIVADQSNRVLFTAIPCVHDGDYGLYDLVGNRFYGSEFLTGA